MCTLEHDEFNSGFQILRTGPSSPDAHHHEEHEDDDPPRPEDPKGLLQSTKSQQHRYFVASRLFKPLASWLPGSSTAPRRAPRRTRRRRSTKARRSEGSSSIKEITTASLL